MLVGGMVYEQIDLQVKSGGPYILYVVRASAGKQPALFGSVGKGGNLMGIVNATKEDAAGSVDEKVSS